MAAAILFLFIFSYLYLVQMIYLLVVGWKKSQQVVAVYGG